MYVGGPDDNILRGCLQQINDGIFAVVYGITWAKLKQMAYVSFAMYRRQGFIYLSANLVLPKTLSSHTIGAYTTARHLLLPSGRPHPSHSVKTQIQVKVGLSQVLVGILVF